MAVGRASPWSTAEGAAPKPDPWVVDQGAIWVAKPPGLNGPWSSLSVSRHRASRSPGTPAAISEGAGTPPTTWGADSRPTTWPGRGHRLVSAAYAIATTPTAS